MTKTLYDPEIEKQGILKAKIEDAKGLIKLGVSVDIITKAIGLSQERINELIEEVAKEKTIN